MRHFGKMFSNIRTYGFSSLFTKYIAIIFCAIIFPVFIFYSATYSISQKNTNEYIYSVNHELCSTIKNIIDTQIDEMNTVAINTSINNEVTSLLLFPTVDVVRDNYLRNQINNYLLVYDFLDSAYIFCDANKKVITANPAVSSLSDLEDKEWYKSYKTIVGNKSSITFRKYKNNYPYLLTIIQPIYTAPYSLAGAVVFNIDIKKLLNSYRFKDFSTAKQLLLVNSQGQIIYSNNDSQISLYASEDENAKQMTEVEFNSSAIMKLNGEKFVITALPSKNYDWAYYCSIPVQHYQSQLSSIMGNLLVLLIISIILSAAISILASKNIIKPIENIMTTLDSPVPWQFPESKKRSSEPDYIVQRIINTKKANLHLLDEQEKRVEVLKRAQIQMLQLQINPHFLGNTLNAINWMAIELTMSNNDVSKAISKLSSMYKAMSDTTNYMTTFENEIEYTQQYIELMKLRYPNAFNVEWNFDESLKNAKLPRMVLQPLIENAIYYGIIPSQKTGKITINITCEKGIISLIINDTGVGIAKEKMNRLNREFLDEYVYFNGGIGLKNVNQRIRLVYGEKYGIQLSQAEGSGLTVTLLFPYIT